MSILYLYDDLGLSVLMFFQFLAATVISFPILDHFRLVIFGVRHTSLDLFQYAHTNLPVVLSEHL